jgi:hypothetical protein
MSIGLALIGVPAGAAPHAETDYVAEEPSGKFLKYPGNREVFCAKQGKNRELDGSFQRI